MPRFLLLFTIFVFPIGLQAQVDYESDIQPIFSANCTSCHGGQSGVTLSSYSAVMNSVGQQYNTEIVDPGNASNSPLMDKISSDDPQFGVRMPQNGSPLSSDEISLIRDWINEGAHEVPTSSEVIADLPDGYALKGNYPNPFNPATTVLFEVPEAVSYTISVYGVNGALLKEYSGRTTPGEVAVNISFANEPTGIYIYKVTATISEKSYLLGAGKMTLIK